MSTNDDKKPSSKAKCLKSNHLDGVKVNEVGQNTSEGSKATEQDAAKKPSSKTKRLRHMHFEVVKVNPLQPLVSPSVRNIPWEGINENQDQPKMSLLDNDPKAKLPPSGEAPSCQQDAEAEGYSLPPTKPRTIGAKMFPELGHEGLHPMQLLCDWRTQEALWKVNCGDNAWGLMQILHLEEPAKMLAYAKVLQREVAEYAKFLDTNSFDPSLKALKIGFAAILTPFWNLSKTHTHLKTWGSKAHLKKTLDDCFTFTGLAEEDLKVTKDDGSENIGLASQVFLGRVMNFLDSVQASDYACEEIQEDLGDMMHDKLDRLAKAEVRLNIS